MPLVFNPIRTITRQAPSLYTSRLLSCPIFSHQSTYPPETQFKLRFTTISVRHKMTDTNQGGDPSKKTYHKKATGNALTTVKNHSKEDDLKLYGSAFW